MFFLSIVGSSVLFVKGYKVKSSQPNVCHRCNGRFSS